MKTVAIAGTFDTKGKEFLYVKNLFEEIGINTLTINTGVFKPAFEADISNEEVIKAVGYDLKEIVEKKDRALATECLSKGIEILVPKLYKQGKFDGIISFGGSGGTSLVTPAMRALPIGVPKIMVSTMASGNTEQYVGTSDVILIPSIVDIAGLNAISTKIFKNSVFAMAGMLKHNTKEVRNNKPLIAATMFGVTTPCIDKAKEYMEDRGYKVLVFHATGTGGKTMESLIESGYFKGVLDLTTTEWCDEIVGGVLNAGPNRCEAAIKNDIPQVVSVGACDMVNFGEYNTIPEKFKGRKFYKHNPTVTLMRTSIDECKRIGDKLAEKWNGSNGNTTVMLPLNGVSMIDYSGQPFYDKEADSALFNTLRNKLDKSKVNIIELENGINDEEFAKQAAQKLIDMIENK